VSVRYIHDITVCGMEHGTVVMDGTAYDLNFDHHRRAPLALSKRARAARGAGSEAGRAPPSRQPTPSMHVLEV
jgi:hypothetical protein